MLAGLKNKKVFCFCLFCMLPVFMKIPEKVMVSVYGLGKEAIREKVTGQIKTASFLSAHWEQGTLYYMPEDREYAPMVLEMLSIYTPILEKEFAVELEKEIPVVMYSDQESLAKALSVSKDNTPMGAYYAGTLYILSPAVWAADSDDWQRIDRFLEEGPVVHELAHLMVDEKLAGKYDIWFTEGVALYMEQKYTGFEWQPERAEEAKKITLTELTKKFSNLDEGAAYRRSYELVSEAIKNAGPNGLLEILDAMADGHPFQTAAEMAREKNK